MRLSALSLAVLVFFFSLNLGPMMFESFTSDRTWASNPPDSFSMFMGPYGQKTAHYWRVVSPLALVSFILALALNWRVGDRALWLSIAFGFYLVIQASTMAFFVPEQEALITSASSLAPELLKARADRWIFWNYFRNVAGVLTHALLLRAIFTPRIS